MRSVIIEAPTLDGPLDPKAFLDWISKMDHYFEWYKMFEGWKIRFAKMKLVGQATQAKLY